MEYTNKQQLVKALRDQLGTDPAQIEKAIVRIFEYQTQDEQRAENTNHYNLQGFRTCDAKILSSFAKQLLRGRHLSEKQLAIAKRRMPVYAGQLIRQSIQKGLIIKENGKYIFKRG